MSEFTLYRIWYWCEILYTVCIRLPVIRSSLSIKTVLILSLPLFSLWSRPQRLGMYSRHRLCMFLSWVLVTSHLRSPRFWSLVTPLIIVLYIIICIFIILLYILIGFVANYLEHVWWKRLNPWHTTVLAAETLSNQTVYQWSTMVTKCWWT